MSTLLHLAPQPEIAPRRALACAAALALAADPAGATGSFPVVVKKGDPAPGMPGVTVRALGSGSFSPGGRMAVVLHLSGAGVNGDNDTSIWLENAAGDLELAFRESDPAPGTGGAIYMFDVYGYAHGAPGELFFHDTVSNFAGVPANQDEGLWVRDAAGVVSLVIREGDPAPLAGPGVVYGCCFNQLETDANGRISFASYLDGPGIDDLNDEALWIREPDGTLVLRARTGEQAPGAPAGAVFATLRHGAELGHGGRLTFAERTVSPSAPQYPDYPDGYGLWTASDSSAPLVDVLLTGDPPSGGAPIGVPDPERTAAWKTASPPGAARAGSVSSWRCCCRCWRRGGDAGRRSAAPAQSSRASISRQSSAIPSPLVAEVATTRSAGRPSAFTSSRTRPARRPGASLSHLVSATSAGTPCSASHASRSSSSSETSRRASWSSTAARSGARPAR